MHDNYTDAQKATIQQLKTHLAQGKGQMTVVAMRSDYEGDRERCLTSVVFVPEPLTQSISQRIIQPLKQLEPEHFYYTPDLMHSTIKNVRTIHTPPLFTPEDVVKADQVFQRIVPQFPVFRFSWQDLTLFPTSVALIGYSNQTLQQLIQALDKGLNDSGIPDNKTYFSDTIFWGNLTICRLTHSPGDAFRQQVQELATVKIGEMQVTQIHLVTCNSVCHPQTRTLIGMYSLNNREQ